MLNHNTLAESDRTKKKVEINGGLRSVWEIVFHHNDISVFRTRMDFLGNGRWPIKLIDFKVAFFCNGCQCYYSCFNFFVGDFDFCSCDS